MEEVSRQVMKKYKSRLHGYDIPGSDWWIAAALRSMGDNHFKLIPGIDGGIYLARFWLTVPKRNNQGRYKSCNSVILHHFVQPDPDRHLHNHPQEFTSQILKGGYVEEVEEGFNTYVKGDVNHIGQDHYHKVTSVQGDTWSLVNTGHKLQGWGFKVDGVHVPYQEYLK
jgi:hypothetical protein